MFLQICFSRGFRPLLSVFLLIYALFFCAGSMAAQSFTGETTTYTSDLLNKKFTSWEVYRMDANALGNMVRASGFTAHVDLRLGGHQWSVSLSPSRILSDRYTNRVLKEDGTIEVIQPNKNIAFKGTTTTGGAVRLTIDRDFIYGFIEEGTETWYIEPARFLDPAADNNMYIVYPRSSVVATPGTWCATEDAEDAARHIGSDLKRAQNGGAESMACFETEIAIASDRSMFDKYGSTAGVDAHNFGVLNNVQGDYTNGQFTHNINFVVVISFTVTGVDPWTSSLDASMLLNSFAVWGNAGGFSSTYDLASLWTNRDFNGNTVGIAVVNGLCNSGRYHCLQDFTSSADFLRVLTSHEIGHNFNAQHDPTGCSNFIMCPVVSTATSWSATTISAINAAVAARNGPSGCLSACGGGGGGSAPQADFTWSPSPACTGQPVQFTNASTGTFTTVTWQFPSGSPSSSAQNNPISTWNVAGTFNVRITVSGTAGTSTITRPVTILLVPVANFNFSVNNLRATFINTTSGSGNTYLWNFGDNTTSTTTNPIHDYALGGTYSVTLTVTSACGTVQITKTVNTIPTAAFAGSPTSGCSPLVVTYTNQSSANATAFLWTFPGGTPSSSTAQNPSVTYSITGTFNVTLRVTNSVGSDTYTAPSYINVQAPPMALFTYAINGKTVTFTNSSTNATSYLWNFGNGNTSTQTNATITYATAGTYTVTLTAINGCGTNTYSETIVIVIPPVAGFTATPTNGCSPVVVQFTNTSTPNATFYNWQFPGGSPATSTDAQPQVTYFVPGTYSVTLTAGNTAGTNTFSRNNYITVGQGSDANFNFSINNRTVTFQNTSSNASSYIWDFGNGNTGTSTNPTVTYAADGTYNVILTAIGTCGQTFIIKEITISSAPTAGFTSGPTTGCTPLTVQYTSTASANATTFNWQFPGGIPATSTAQNPLVVYQTSGTYSVIFTASNNVGSATATQTNYITANSAPVTGFTQSVNNSTATFSNTTTNATTYSWNFGDNTTSTNANPTRTYLTDGTYTVVLSATNACGTTTFSRTVIIATQPSAGFTVANASGCAPFIVQFSNTSSTNVTGYNWQFPGGMPATSTLQNPSVAYSAPGAYSVTLTVSNATGTATAVQNNIVTVNPKPTTAFISTIVGRTVTFANNSSNAVSYQWSFGDGNTSTQPNPGHTYAADGTYTVVLTATNTCGTTTAAQTVVIATAPTAGFTAANTTGCGPLTVQYTNTSSVNSNTFNWQFPGGNPATSTAQNPAITYNAAGTYSVTLTVGNSIGNNTATQTNVVTVAPVPTAAFTAATSGRSVAFANISVNATAYSWSFGDSNTSTQANPNHTYAADGTYMVVLTATNTCGTTTSSQTVVIATAPTAGFTAANTTGCGPLIVQYTNTSSVNSNTFNWQFPGGNPATSAAQNPAVTYNTAGTYSATLTVGNSVGNNTATQTNLVTVAPVPTAAFTAATSGRSVAFANISVNATAYSWSFGDSNTSTQANPNHTYAADGTYTVVLTATNTCGTTTSSQTVVIATAPIAGFTAANTSGCGPLIVQYTSTSSANSNIFNWQFPGGNPATSTAQNPTVTYNTAGTYSATLTVGNSVGNNTATQTNVVTVAPVPTAAFTTATSGRSVAFSNASVNATAYSWSFGDSNTSIQANPNHTYAADGTYTVVLTAANTCGITTSSQTVVIATAPIAGFTAANTTGCGPLIVQYTSTSSANSNIFNWQFPGGNPATSTAQNPAVTYNNAGTYSATLTVGNSVGNNTATQTNVVTVGSKPTTSFNSSVNGLTASFFNSSVNAVSYSWSFGNGSGSTDATPTHTYATDGIYSVVLIATNACGSNTHTQNVVIVTSPTAGFTANTTSGCGPLTVQFADLSTANTTSWAWSFPGGNPATSTVQHPTVIYDTPGTYNVTLVASTTAGSNTFERTNFISVSSTPVAGFTASVNAQTVTFNNTSSSNATNYSWHLGDGTVVTATNPIHAYLSGGTYTVVLTTSNTCGGQTFTFPVVVNPPPPTAAFTSNLSTHCGPVSVTFTDQSTGAPIGWAWSFPGGTPSLSTQRNPTIFYATSGTFAATLLVNNAGGFDTITIQNAITIQALPLANFAVGVNNATASFTNLTQNYQTLLWDFGDGNTSTAINPVHVYATSGAYIVKLTITNACGTNTIQQTLQITLVGAEDIAVAWNLRVFPNPGDGKFTLQASGLSANALELWLFNTLGESVGREVAVFHNGTISDQFDYSHLPSGIYTLQLRSGSKLAIKKLIIE